jgi:uncharacterized protein (TIGR02246 family)
MFRFLSTTLLAATVVSAAPAPAPPLKDKMQSLLTEDARAWSRGDLDAFCSSYADDATFISPSGETHGRQAVLDRYRAKYKDKTGMGTLTLDVTEVRSLSDSAVSVIATWRLVWPDKPEAKGLTLLVFTKTKDGWRIVQDASM